MRLPAWIRHLLPQHPVAQPAVIPAALTLPFCTRCRKGLHKGEHYTVVTVLHDHCPESEPVAEVSK